MMIVKLANGSLPEHLCEIVSRVMWYQRRTGQPVLTMALRLNSLFTRLFSKHKASPPLLNWDSIRFIEPKQNADLSTAMAHLLWSSVVLNAMKRLWSRLSLTESTSVTV
uniref:Putative endonuclease n=1 Tax=Ixodes ricinus TaxID=34613 RepID=A0A0K8RJ64_IXORI